MEAGLYHHYFGESEAARAAFKHAQEQSGLYVNLTGALGRRTRYQVFDTAQLVLEASSRGANAKVPATLPKEVANPDDLLLPEPKYAEPLAVRPSAIHEQTLQVEGRGRAYSRAHTTSCG